MAKRFTDAAKRKMNEAALLAQAPQPIVEFFDDPSTCQPTIAFHFKGRSAKACVDALLNAFEEWTPAQALTFYEQNAENPNCQ
jgi:hypothetical protein